MNTLKETENKSYTNIDNIKKEVEDAKRTFKKYKWPMIDVTREICRGNSSINNKNIRNL